MTADELNKHVKGLMEKTFKLGFEIGMVEALDPKHKPQSLTFIYRREELADAAWEKAKKGLI